MRDKVGNGFNPDRFVLGHDMGVWSRKRLQDAPLCHCPLTTSPTSVMLVSLSEIEACRRRWWSSVQKCITGSVQRWSWEEVEMKVSSHHHNCEGMF